MADESSTLCVESHVPTNLVAEGRLGSVPNPLFTEVDKCFRSFVMQKSLAIQSFVHINIPQGRLMFT